MLFFLNTLHIQMQLCNDGRDGPTRRFYYGNRDVLQYLGLTFFLSLNDQRGVLVTWL